jgi:L-alanine-DL-glutamate epimerase-like enolase superfamily enzyme
VAKANSQLRAVTGEPDARRPVKITKVDVRAVEVPLTSGFSGSRYSLRTRCAILTEMHTEDGLISQVYNGDNRDRLLDLRAIIEKDLVPLVIGEDIFAYERIWQKLFAATQWNRDRKIMMQAVGCLDSAVWDLVGKALGISVGRLLGGFRDEIEIISIGGYYGADKGDREIALEMQSYLESGIGGCKFKVGGLSPEEDARRVAAARDGAGKDFLLAVDANQAWSAGEAIRFAGLVERYDIAWFEEPCRWYDDGREMAEVRRRTSIPVTAGQTELSSHGVRRLIEAGAVDIVTFNASLGGGISEWRRVAALCATFNLTMSHHEEPHLALQLMSSVPQGLCVECFGDPQRDPIWADMVLNRPRAKDGKMRVPKGPGFGLELDQDMIARFEVG